VSSENLTLLNITEGIKGFEDFACITKCEVILDAPNGGYAWIEFEHWGVYTNRQQIFPGSKQVCSKEWNIARLIADDNYIGRWKGLTLNCDGKTWAVSANRYSATVTAKDTLNNWFDRGNPSTLNYWWDTDTMPLSPSCNNLRVLDIRSDIFWCNGRQYLSSYTEPFSNKC